MPDGSAHRRDPRLRLQLRGEGGRAAGNRSHPLLSPRALRPRCLASLCARTRAHHTPSWPLPQGRIIRGQTDAAAGSQAGRQYIHVCRLLSYAALLAPELRELTVL